MGRANSSLLEKQKATQRRPTKAVTRGAESRHDWEISSFSLDLNGTQQGLKRYPYFG